MPATLPLPQISTNVRLVASRLLFPELAGAWAERLFLTPPAPQDAAASALDLIDGRSSLVLHKGRHISTWRWGSIDSPAVLLVHGWGGHAAQMRAFVFPLLATGYRVVAYDQPAHGVSEGRLTGLPDFADVMAEVAWHHGDVRAVIAHSLGATAAAMAHAWKKLDVRKFVLISPPSDLMGYSRRFARWHWMPERVRRSMQSAIEERYGLRWEELELARVAPHLAAAASMMTTQGLGHRRILEDEAVTKAAAEFLR